MKQALAFIFLILNMFSQPDEQVNGNMQSPVTSIRFRLSGIHDIRKHHVFEFHSFSRLQSLKWVYLDNKLLQHCLLIKQLPVSECTYDNIKELECGSLKHREPNVGLELSSYVGFNKEFVAGILPMGVSKGACNRISQPALSVVAKPGKLPQFALSFSAAPTFFLGLHLQILMKNSFAWSNLHHRDALCSQESSENGSQPDADSTQFESSLVAVQDIAEHNIGTLETEAPAFRGLASSNKYLVADVGLLSNVIEKVGSSQRLHKANPDNAGSFKEFEEITPEGIAPSIQSESSLHEQNTVSLPSAPVSEASSTPRSGSRLGGMTVDIPSCDQVGVHLDRKGCISRQASDVGWKVSEGFVQSPNPRGSKRPRQGGRSRSISSSLGDLSPIWRDGSPKFMLSGFSSGLKKPRTQYDTFPGVLPCKRVRRVSQRISDGSRSNQKNFDFLSCCANVLVTHGDKGWRECGALIVLEVADHNEWRLAIKLSGITKYAYKVKHILLPGSINRYTNAMLWKGGKDWVLEFPERSQWMLFKELHDECYNRNIRAASVRNIPIPGVRLVEESDDYGPEVPFVRNSTKYYRQVQTDIEMAMDPSHVLYDMDSDDEQWLMANRKYTDGDRCEEISEEFLEKTMDMFEKVSYAQHRDNFTDAEIQELVNGVVSVEAAKVIYEHWREKRGRKGMPLIRQLQPPLWEMYQKQLKEWQHTVARGKSAVSVRTREKVPAAEQPPMFAFCLRPRTLDVRNKGSKQRSHRKFAGSRRLHATSVEHNRLPNFGRRSRGRPFRDEKISPTSSINESSRLSPSPPRPMRMLSSREAHLSLSIAVTQSSPTPTPYENKRKKRYYSEGPNRRGVNRLRGSNINALQVHRASAAAKQFHTAAKLKREKAEALFSRADLYLFRARAFAMTAEAIKAAAKETSNGGD